MSAGIHKIDFSSPDEVRRPDKTTVEIISIGNVNVARMTVQPGWVWSECIAPVAGTESCQAHHLGIVQSGQLLVNHEDRNKQTALPFRIQSILYDWLSLEMRLETPKSTSLCLSVFFACVIIFIISPP